MILHTSMSTADWFHLLHHSATPAASSSRAGAVKLMKGKRGQNPCL